MLYYCPCSFLFGTNIARNSHVSTCSSCPESRANMGAGESKTSFYQAVTHLDTNSDLWDQLASESFSSVQEVFNHLPSEDIRKMREDSPSHLAKLCCKLVERLTKAVDSSCRTQADHQAVLNSCRVLTRIIPFIFEDPDWRSFFWSRPEASGGGRSIDGSSNEPTAFQRQQSEDGGGQEVDEQPPLGHSLLMAVADLLFCPEFTVAASSSSSGPGGSRARDEVDELANLDSCEFIWEKGVGFAQNQPNIPQYHHNRSELLRLLLTCFSQSMYLPPQGEAHLPGDRWVRLFTSPSNRHALPIFTSLLNTVCGYLPGGILPYNHLIWSDSKEKLVEMALQVLIVSLDQDPPSQSHADQSYLPDNLFLSYLSRIHRDEDFNFILTGMTRLLMNPLTQTYLPYSQRKVHFHQELMIFFWKFCEHNKKFLFYVLKSSDVLDILVPILHYLNDARADQSRVGLMHIGVFILLLLSGERNFGVRLNKPYTAAIPMDIPVFAGSHGDLLIIVIHKIITNGHHRLQPLFDCLLTILCNVSPYLKSLSMTAACKIIHLVEAFSTPWFLFSTATNHNLIYFLLEMLNNLIQYQFDGNANLVYTIIRKRAIFYQLANLSADSSYISRNLKKKSRKEVVRKDSHNDDTSMEGSVPAVPAQPGTLKTSLIRFPGVESVTEAASAHPTSNQLQRLTLPAMASGTSDQASNSSSVCPVQPLEPSVKENNLSSTVPQNNRQVVNQLDADIHPISGKLINHTPLEIGGQIQHSPLDITGQLQQSPLDIAGQIHPSPLDIDGQLGFSEDPLDNAMKDLGLETKSDQSPGPIEADQKKSNTSSRKSERSRAGSVSDNKEDWSPTPEWVASWKNKLPLHTVMRLLQVLVPQVEKMCVEKGLTDESEILRFLQHGTLVGLLPVPHPILIRRYQPNPGTAMWFRTYMWGVVYLRNIDPAVWYDTDIKLFQVQRI